MLRICFYDQIHFLCGQFRSFICSATEIGLESLTFSMVNLYIELFGHPVDSMWNSSKQRWLPATGTLIVNWQLPLALICISEKQYFHALL